MGSPSRRPTALVALLSVVTAAWSAGAPAGAVTSGLSDADLAKHWAPVFYHDTDDSDASADEIARFDFDGDWVGRNNWDNEPSFSHFAYVYYHVVETDTNYHIGYAAFHPRDWSDGPDPDLGEHENDLEGALVVVQKDGSTFGAFLAVHTVAHQDFWTYTDVDAAPSNQVTADSRMSDTPVIDGDVDFWTADGGRHVELGIQAKGHGIYRREDSRVWDSGRDDFRGGDGIVYYPRATAEAPSGGNDRDVSYALLHASDLWTRRSQFGDAAPFASYGSFRGDASGGCGSGFFEVCMENSAKAPWAWDDWNDGGSYRGEWFEHPALLTDWYLDGLGAYSLAYRYRSVGGVAESFHDYENSRSYTWTWRKAGALSVRVHFPTIATQAGADFVEVLDGAGAVAWSRSGSHADQWSPWVSGDRLGVRFRSDGGGTAWGFYADLLEGSFGGGGGGGCRCYLV